MPLRYKSDLDSSGFEAGIKRMFKAAAGFGLSFAGIGYGIKTLLNFGSELRDSADSIGLNVEAMQELEYAFGQSGAKAEVVDKALVRLTESITAAQSGNKQAISSFERLGIAMDTIDKGDVDKILMRTADALKESKNPGETLAAVMDVLGKGGAKMAAGLRQGTDELARLRAETTKLSESDVNALDKAGDMLARAWRVTKVLGSRALVGTANAANAARKGYFGDLSTGALSASDAEAMHAKLFPKSAPVATAIQSAATLERLQNEKSKREKDDESDRVGRFKEEMGRLNDREQFERQAAQIREQGMREEKSDREAFNRLIKDSQDIAIKAYEDTLTDEQLLKKLEKDRADIWLELRLSAVGLSKITAEEGAEKRKQLDDLSVRIQKEKQITKEIKERTDFAKKLEGHHLDPALTRTNIHEERRRAREEYLRSRRFGGSAKLDIQSGLSSAHEGRGMTAREKALARLPATITAQLDSKSIGDLTAAIERLISK